MSHFDKRQIQVSRSVVHITVTSAGTVVYTQTATSYSYIPTYSTITPPGTSLPNNNGNTSSTNNGSSTNTGAIVGGVVGGVAAIALIGLGVFLLHRSKKSKNLQPPPSIDDDDSYYEGHRHQRSSSKANITPRPLIPAPRNENIYYDVPHSNDHAEPPHTKD